MRAMVAALGREEVESGAGIETPLAGTPAATRLRQRLAPVLLDAVLSGAFWCGLLLIPWTTAWLSVGIVVLLIAMVLWRVRRAKRLPRACAEAIPYSCGYASANGKELFLVATVHISPRAPKDVEAVIAAVRPDLVMIELDEERLDSMREGDTPQDLQPLEVTEADSEPTRILTQRALWNAEHSGVWISGSVVYDGDNAYGMAAIWSEQVRDGLALVHRGPLGAGSQAAFTVKAHRAAAAGAKAVLVINSEEQLPVSRIGTGTLLGDLKAATHTRSCGFPPVPVLLLPRGTGQQLCATCSNNSAGCVRGEFQVLPDTYPRRTLRRQLCQLCALTLSGVGILYCIIEYFSVEVGAEFVMAEAAAAARGIRCSCIDVDLDRLCSRVSAAVLPTPCNLGSALLSWLAFPRVLFQVCFPSPHSIDAIGTGLLHVWSFRCRIWVAAVLAGLCAGGIVAGLLLLFGNGVAGAAQHTGVISHQDSTMVQAVAVLSLEVYLMARMYEAVSTSRDEAMWRGIAQQAQEHSAQRLVAVVGAAHANGILHRVRERGL